VPEVKLPFYVHVTRADLLRLTPRWREQHVAQASVLTKVDPAGHCVCVALRGTVGNRVSCAIYERRPNECRKLDAGSAACLKARRQAGVVP
jgi:Fe-S-cluster containining protein